MPGLLDSGLLDQNTPYAPNPNFTASLAAPQISATPRAGFGNIMPQQAPPPAASLAQPSLGGGFTHDDVQKALGMLYGQLGGGVDWVKATGGPQGLLGQAPAAAGGQPGTPQPGGGAQTLVDAYRGFKQYDEINNQIQQAKRLFDNEAGGSRGGREGGGIV